MPKKSRVWSSAMRIMITPRTASIESRRARDVVGVWLMSQRRNTAPPAGRSGRGRLVQLPDDVAAHRRAAQEQLSDRLLVRQRLAAREEVLRRAHDHRQVHLCQELGFA